MNKREKQYYKYFVLSGMVSEDDFRKMQEVKGTIPHDEFVAMCNEMRERHRQSLEKKRQLKAQRKNKN